MPQRRWKQMMPSFLDELLLPVQLRVAIDTQSAVIRHYQHCICVLLNLVTSAVLVCMTVGM